MAKKRMVNLFDEMDYRIIQELNKNARVSAAQISRTIGVKERTIRERIDRLIELNVGRMALVINPSIFGYGISVDIFLDIKPEYEEAIIKELMGVPQICFLANGQNSNEISIEARFKKVEDMYRFLRTTLPEIPGVRVKDYALVPRIVRDIDQWLPSREDFGISEEPSGT
jgi:DNA-binding Lrp family transcriptional regulator